MFYQIDHTINFFKTESVSPNNEEATSQDLSQSGGEASNNVSDYNNGPVYNMIYPGYYVNGVCSQGKNIKLS